ncbi:MAG: response regulator transcription factor [Lachnospiraceae bacterium]|nr:response regulator transcription factor [Lachnospiraceae bacterium]
MRILISVNNNKNEKRINDILNTNGFSTDRVKTYNETLEYLDTGIYDALVISSSNPEPKGLKLLKKLRKERNELPILVICPKDSPMDVVNALNYGADDSMAYPFFTEEFLARLRTITTGKRISTPKKKEITYKDIKLNRITNELLKDDKASKLTNKEYQIIELLLLNPEVPITTEAFMSKIWGYESESGYSVVWSTVTNLRRKLKNLNSEVKIELRRNIGYTLK